MFLKHTLINIYGILLMCKFPNTEKNKQRRKISLRNFGVSKNYVKVNEL